MKFQNKMKSIMKQKMIYTSNTSQINVLDYKIKTIKINGDTSFYNHSKLKNVSLLVFFNMF